MHIFNFDILVFNLLSSKTTINFNMLHAFMVDWICCNLPSLCAGIIEPLYINPNSQSKTFSHNNSYAPSAIA